MLTLLINDTERQHLLDALQLLVIKYGQRADALPSKSDAWTRARENLNEAARLRRRLEFMP